jgi:hypothetical protein
VRAAVRDDREGDQVGCRVLELRALAAGLVREIKGVTSLCEIGPVTRQLDEQSSVWESGTVTTLKIGSSALFTEPSSPTSTIPASVGCHALWGG